MKQQASLLRINNGKSDGKINHRGKTVFSIEASTTKLVNLIAYKLRNSGWSENDTFCGEESEKYEGGECRLFIVDVCDVDHFKADFQTAKKRSIYQLK